MFLLSTATRGYAEPIQPVSVINLLVLYTPQASAGAGGTTSILEQINTAMMEANTVFQNSRINARVHLTLAAGINYLESGSVSNDLARLRDPGNGILGQAHRLRDQFRADLVCLVTETGSDWWFYGLQGPSADNAFSIVRRPFLTGGYYFPVALSFNFGCQLERSYADSVGAFAYAYGHSFWVEDTLYSTVEAFSGQRIPFFSNPDILFQGVPIGVPAGLVNSANNALVMNQTAPTVAAFRGSALVTLPPQASITAPGDAARFRAGTNVIFSANATDPDGKVVRVDYYEGTNWLASSGTPPFKALWRKVPVGEHSPFAMATDNVGATTISQPIHITVVPTNDDFVARTRLVGTTDAVRASNILATAEPAEPDHAGFSAAHSLWWTYTAPVGGVVRLDASASSFAASLAVYTGNVLNALTEITSTSGTDESAVRFEVAAGQAYQIALDSPDGETGDVELHLSFAPAPANDNFAHRQLLSGNSIRLRANNQGATREADEPNHSNTLGSASLWWSWTAPADGSFSLTVNSSRGANLLLGVYTGDALTNLLPVPSQFQYPASFVLAAEKGVSYQIAVDNPVDPLQPGSFELNLSFTPAPRNDDFANRIPIRGTWISLTNSSALATLEPGEPAHDYTAWPSIWWSWTAPISGSVTISSPTYSYFDIYVGGSLTNLTPVAGGSPATFEAVAGTTYAIAASGPPGSVVLNLSVSTVRLTSPTSGTRFTLGMNIPLTASATANDGPIRQMEFFANGSSIGVARRYPFTLVWSNAPVGDYALTAVATDSSGHTRSSPAVSVTFRYPRPPNDDFVDRTVLHGTWILLTNSDIEATSEPGEPNIAGTYWGDSIWWSWTATVAGRVTITSATDSAFGVYTGASVSNLTEVASGFSPVIFDASAGTTYEIAGAGWPGNVVLQLVLSNLRIMSPIDGATFTAGTDIPIVASAGSTEGPVRQVEFFHNGVSLGLATGFPYGITWSNAPGGIHTLTAIATDDQGMTRSSQAVSIRVKPANDDFSDAIALSGGLVQTNGSTAGATKEPGEPPHNGQEGGRSVWYSWTAPDSDRYSVIADSNGRFSLLLAVYRGADLSDLILVCSNAYWRGAAFSAQAGARYLIAVDSGGAEGDFSLGILKPPANDDFTDLILITNANTTVIGNNLGASWEPGERLYAYYGGQSVWWTWTAPRSGRVTFTTQATASTPMLHVYTGSSVSNLTLLPGQVGGPWDEIDDLAFDVTAGTSYAIAADEKWNADWSVAFTLNFTARPDNDDFANAFALAGTSVAISGDNTVATPETGEPNHAGSTSGHSIWYCWTAPIRGLVTVGAASTNSTALVRVYTGTNVAALTLIGTNSTAGSSFISTAGTSYQIAVDGSGGFFTLNLALIPAPSNDAFESRFLLGGLNPTVQGTTFLASFQPGEPGFYPWMTDRSAWYSWTAPADGTVRVHCPSRPIAVYSGSSVTNLAVVAAVNPAHFDDLVFLAAAGTEYEIAVAGAGWLPDDFTLSIVMPKAQIASPANGAAFAPPANFEIVARTIDIDGAVVSVSFFDGTNLLATVTNAPFQMEYRNLPVGSHLLSLQAMDANGLTTTSEPTEVRVKPPNDDFAQRFVIRGALATFVANNAGATIEAGEPQPGGASGRTLWWTWTAPSNGIATLAASPFSTAGALSTRTSEASVSGSTCRADSGPVRADVGGVIITPPYPPGPTNGPLICVYIGAALANLSLYSSNSAWFDQWVIRGEWCVLPSVSFPVIGGQTYQFSLDGLNGSFGSATVAFSLAPPPVLPSPPVNDDFAQATLLSGSSLTVTGTTVAATRQPGEPSHGVGPGARTVWYSWTAPASGAVQAGSYASGSGGGMALGIYAGSSLWNLIPVASGLGEASFYALAGTTYKIAVVGPDGLEVSFSLALNALPPPPVIDAAHTVRLPNGNYRVRVTGGVGQSFVVQASSDSRNWVTVRTDTLSGTYLDFVDTAAAAFRQRFYRVLSFDAAFNYRPFVLLAPSIQSDAGFSLHLAGMAGQPFRLQASTNCLDWSDLIGGILANETFGFTDQDAPKFNCRFYRAVKQ